MPARFHPPKDWKRLPLFMGVAEIFPENAGTFSIAQNVGGRSAQMHFVVQKSGESRRASGADADGFYNAIVNKWAAEKPKYREIQQR